MRIGIDKNNNLQECPIEFEVVQEFAIPNGGGASARDEKTMLGVVKLNLAEYLEESEVVARDSLSLDSSQNTRSQVATPNPGKRRRNSAVNKHHYHKHERNKSVATASSGDGISPTRVSGGDDKMGRTAVDEERVQEGIIRRYLMHDSKINSTLKIGILMIQVDGDRNYVAPPLRTAPVFGGIAGLMGAEPVDGQEEAGQLPAISKPRDTSEQQDMYRRALAASWTCQQDELPAHECIEDIFSGGTGWRSNKKKEARRGRSGQNEEDTTEDTADEVALGWGKIHSLDRPGEWGDTLGDIEGGATSRASDMLRIQHLRAASGTSDRSIVTVIGPSKNAPITHTDSFLSPARRREGHEPRRRGGLRNEETITPTSVIAAATRENENRKTPILGNRNRSESLVSLATTLGSEGRSKYDDYRKQMEVDEFETREDLVSWSLSGAV